jgi:purine-cytosine permease-like protein
MKAFFSNPKTSKLAKYPAMLLVLIGAAKKNPVLMMLGFILAMAALGWAYSVLRKQQRSEANSAGDQ